MLLVHLLVFATAAFLPPLEMCFDDGQCLRSLDAYTSTPADDAFALTCFKNASQLILSQACSPTQGNGSAFINDGFLDVAHLMWPDETTTNASDIDMAAVYAYFMASMMGIAATMNASGAAHHRMPAAWRHPIALTASGVNRMARNATIQREYGRTQTYRGINYDFVNGTCAPDARLKQPFVYNYSVPSFTFMSTSFSPQMATGWSFGHPVFAIRMSRKQYLNYPSQFYESVVNPATWLRVLACDTIYSKLNASQSPQFRPSLSLVFMYELRSGAPLPAKQERALLATMRAQAQRDLDSCYPLACECTHTPPDHDKKVPVYNSTCVPGTVWPARLFRRLRRASAAERRALLRSLDALRGNGVVDVDAAAVDFVRRRIHRRDGWLVIERDAAQFGTGFRRKLVRVLEEIEKT